MIKLHSVVWTCLNDMMIVDLNSTGKNFRGVEFRFFSTQHTMPPEFVLALGLGDADFKNVRVYTFFTFQRIGTSSDYLMNVD